MGRWNETFRSGVLTRTLHIALFGLAGCSSTDQQSAIDGGAGSATESGGGQEGAASGDSAGGPDGDASGTPEDASVAVDAGAEAMADDVLDASEAGDNAESGSVPCVPTTPTCCAPTQLAMLVTDLCGKAAAPVGQGTSLPVSGTFVLIQHVTYTGLPNGCASFTSMNTEQTTLLIQGASWSAINDAVIGTSSTSGHASYTVSASGSTVDITKVCANGRDLILPVSSGGTVTYDFTDPALNLYSGTDGYYLMRQ